MAQAVGPDTNGAISGSNNGEGVGVLVSRTTGVWNTGTGFEALNHLTAGNEIRQRVFGPCLVISVAVTTPLRAFIRSTPIPPGFLTVPLELIRWRTTPPALTTLPTVILHSLSTRPVPTITPLVLLRSTRTPPAATTPLLGSMPVSIRLRAATISISAIRT
jgi:hypothetical protein